MKNLVVGLALCLAASVARAQTGPVIMAPCVGTSYTVTLTGAAQLVAPQIPQRRHLFLFGSSVSSRIDMGFDSTVTQGAGIPLFAGGGGYEFSEPGVPQSPIWINGAAGQTVYCAQGG